MGAQRRHSPGAVRSQQQTWDGAQSPFVSVCSVYRRGICWFYGNVIMQSVRLHGKRNLQNNNSLVPKLQSWEIVFYVIVP